MSGRLEFYEAMKYIAKERKELSMVFHFGHLQIVCDFHLYIENWGITFSTNIISGRRAEWQMGYSQVETLGIQGKDTDVAAVHPGRSW